MKNYVHLTITSVTFSKLLCEILPSKHIDLSEKLCQRVGRHYVGMAPTHTINLNI